MADAELRQLARRCTAAEAEQRRPPQVQPFEVRVAQRLWQLTGQPVATQQDVLVRQQHQLLANGACMPGMGSRTLGRMGWRGWRLSRRHVRPSRRMVYQADIPWHLRSCVTHGDS